MMTLQRQPIAPSHRLLSTLCARLAWCAVGLCLLGLLTPLARAQASPKEILKGRFESVRNASKDNPFGRDLFLESSESSTELKGDVYALVDSPYAKLAAALKQPANWCDVLNLHINTKSCVPDGREAPTQMAVHIGRKHDQPLTDAYLINFSFRLHSAGADYFLARMDAPTGPLATRDYRIAMEATPWDANRSLVHLTYAYGFGMPGRLAMQGYLATLGSGKVGFTITGRRAAGSVDYIDGVRGVVERNTMRYYLAIDAYLTSLREPPADQLDRRLKIWFDATETHARQLHELDWPAYLAMKHSESQRQPALR